MEVPVTPHRFCGGAQDSVFSSTLAEVCCAPQKLLPRLPPVDLVLC